MEDIAFTAELERLVATKFWHVGVACRMLLGIDIVQSAGHNYFGDKSSWVA